MGGNRSITGRGNLFVLLAFGNRVAGTSTACGDAALADPLAMKL